MQNFFKLPYLEVTFLETSYLCVFRLFRPIIYRPDELFHFFCRFCISPWRLTSGKNFMVILLLSSLGGGTTPPPFTCKPVSNIFTCKPLKYSHFVGKFYPFMKKISHNFFIEIALWYYYFVNDDKKRLGRLYRSKHLPPLHREKSFKSLLHKNDPHTCLILQILIFLLARKIEISE